MSAAFANLARRVPVLLTLFSRMTHRPQPLTTCVGLLMLSLGPVAALQPGAAATALSAGSTGSKDGAPCMADRSLSRLVHARVAPGSGDGMRPGLGGVGLVVGDLRGAQR